MADQSDRELLEDAARPWDNLRDVLPVLKDASAGRWSWTENTACKYVELRIDMRDGGCIIRDRNGNRITPEQLANQPYGKGGLSWNFMNELRSGASTSSEGTKG